MKAFENRFQHSLHCLTLQKPATIEQFRNKGGVQVLQIQVRRKTKIGVKIKANQKSPLVPLI